MRIQGVYVMQILLDTQSLIWALTNPDNLTSKARGAIYEATNVYISPISFYEMAIKIAIGKAPAPTIPISNFMSEALLADFSWLPLSAEHIEAYTRLPLFEQHRDPFDRMILAIALADELTVISSDRHFSLYRNTVNVLW